MTFKGVLINIHLEGTLCQALQKVQGTYEWKSNNYSRGTSVPVSGSGWSEGATETAENSRHFSLTDSGLGLNTQPFP